MIRIGLLREEKIPADNRVACRLPNANGYKENTRT
jgi:hypothetical protein